MKTRTRTKTVMVFAQDEHGARATALLNNEGWRATDHKAKKTPNTFVVTLTRPAVYL